MGATQSKTTQCVYETPRGSLTGIEYWSHVNKPVCRRFTRVPYALPPIGQLRWRRPQPLPESFSFSEPSGKPGNYTSFGPVCPQPVYAYSDVLLENKDAAPEPELIEKRIASISISGLLLAPHPKLAGQLSSIYMVAGYRLAMQCKAMPLTHSTFWQALALLESL